MTSEERRVGFRGFFEWFVRSEVTGSILLLGCTVIALVWANSPWDRTYSDLLHTYIGVSWGGAEFKLSLHHWINDGLMVIFFFVVGLEVKRELVVGELSTIRKATLPVAAAVGGMMVPAVLFALFNFGGEGARGWGIPMATDIAFALGVLAIFGTRAPLGLKVFLTALAIADDLGAVAVIAIFYTDTIDIRALIVAAGLLVVLFVAIRANFRSIGLLLPLIVGFWLAVFASGVHATVAGILVAMLIPVRPRLTVEAFVRHAEDFMHGLAATGGADEVVVPDTYHLNAVERHREVAADILPPGLVLEHMFHPVQVWFILPLFALANAGVAIGGDLMEVLANPLALGIIIGLVIGKPLGISLLSWLAVRTGGSALPEGVTWGQIAGAGCLAGIGFTMSLFISDLAFDDEMLIATAKVGILAASLASGILGFVILSRSLPKA
jgi:NhaA family Na+:H+ antiporter